VELYLHSPTSVT